MQADRGWEGVSIVGCYDVINTLSRFVLVSPAHTELWQLVFPVLHLSACAVPFRAFVSCGCASCVGPAAALDGVVQCRAVPVGPATKQWRVGGQSRRTVRRQLQRSPSKHGPERVYYVYDWRSAGGRLTARSCGIPGAAAAAAAR